VVEGCGQGCPCRHPRSSAADGASFHRGRKLWPRRRATGYDGTAEEFPAYGFERHKGYGTAAHLDALRRHVPCPAHRKSFAPVAQLTLDL
jgi:hypothetical protein